MIVMVDDTNYNSLIGTFDSNNEFWMNLSDYNTLFLKGQQNLFNDLLKTKGYVFLNEVRHTLGLEETQMGQIFGWNGTTPIDFGIKVSPAPLTYHFLFNVNGSIINLLP